MVKVALVLSGCGVFDGSEIHEASACMVHLSRLGAEVEVYAPDVPQMHVVDHAAGSPSEGERRSVLTESARIARGPVKPLSTIEPEAFDAIVFPGGFGAAKNLCDFAVEGAACAVEPSVERAIKGFHAAGKPIGLCCIAPVLAARVLGSKLGGPGVTVTIGNDEGTASAIEAMGSTHENRPVTEACVDEANKVVTAPAYMYGDAPVHEVAEGIGRMIEKTLELAAVGAGA